MDRYDSIDVDDALRRVTEIHEQMARATHFRGYRAVPVALMGAVALVTGVAETLWIEKIDASLHALVWLGVAAACAMIGAVDVWIRRRGLPTRTIRLALLQLVPSLCVGLALGVLLRDRPEILPGVWTMVFGLGVLASRPYLPRPILGVALFYSVAGCAMAFAGRPGEVPSPLAMGLTYAIGQAVSAAALRNSSPEGDVKA